jgi:hypothetical protein
MGDRRLLRGGERPSVTRGEEIERMAEMVIADLSNNNGSNLATLNG